MKLIRGLWRFFRLLYPLGWGLVHGNAKHLRALKSTPPDPEAQQKNQEWYRRVLACLNIRVSMIGQPAEAPCSGGMQPYLMAGHPGARLGCAGGISEQGGSRPMAADFPLVPGGWDAVYSAGRRRRGAAQHRGNPKSIQTTAKRRSLSRRNNRERSHRTSVPSTSFCGSD